MLINDLGTLFHSSCLSKIIHYEDRKYVNDKSIERGRQKDVISMDVNETLWFDTQTRPSLLIFSQDRDCVPVDYYTYTLCSEKSGPLNEWL